VNEPVPNFKFQDTGNFQDLSTSRCREEGPLPLQHVRSMFKSSLADEVIQDVVNAHGSNIESCIDVLVALSQGTTGSALTDPIERCDCPSGSSARSTPGLVPSHTTVVRGQDLWATLPDDIKLLLVNRLGTKDVACMAMVSKDMARCAAYRRARVTLLRVRGSIENVHHCIGAHPNATGVRSCSLPRCAHWSVP
jgi:hypothetical protein